MKPLPGANTTMALNMILFVVAFFAIDTSSFAINPNRTATGQITAYEVHASQITADQITAHPVTARQGIDQFENYPCWLCQPGEDESPDLGGDSCTEARDDEGTCPEDLDQLSLVSIQTSKTGSWIIDGEKWEITYDNYPSCSAAAKKEPVAKWYGFPVNHDPSQCPLQIQHMDQPEVVTKIFQADHVYECQTLLHFFQWLRGDFQVVAWPESYQRPSTAWILRILMGTEQDFLDLEPFTWDDLTVWDHATNELGSYGQPGRLALVQGSVNKKKGTFFEGNRNGNLPDRESRIGPVKRWQRDVAGVFQYMKDRTVWDIFTETSKAIEDVFSYFDLEYDWADEGALGRPERGDGEPLAGLRDLYCYFIDNRLHELESRAIEWLISSKSTFESQVIEDPAHPDEKDEWLGQFVTGIFTVDKFVFPRGEGAVDDDGRALNSLYSAWDNGPAGPW